MIIDRVNQSERVMRFKDKFVLGAPGFSFVFLNWIRQTGWLMKLIQVSCEK